MRARFMPFCTRPMNNAPRMTFSMRPTPPRKLTPAMTQAAIEPSGMEAPMLASPVSSRAVSSMPATALSRPHNV